MASLNAAYFNQPVPTQYVGLDAPPGAGTMGFQVPSLKIGLIDAQGHFPVMLVFVFFMCAINPGLLTPELFATFTTALLGKTVGKS